MKHKKVLLQVKASIYDSGEFEKTTNITNNKDIVKRLDGLFKAIKNNKHPGYNWRSGTELIPDPDSKAGWKAVPKAYELYPEIEKEDIDLFIKFIPNGTNHINSISVLYVNEETIL